MVVVASVVSIASIVGVGYLGRAMSVGSVVGLWFSGGSGWFNCGWCFWWQFFLVILVVKNQCLWLSFDGRWLCRFTGE